MQDKQTEGKYFLCALKTGFGTIPAEHTGHSPAITYGGWRDGSLEINQCKQDLLLSVGKETM